MRSAALLDSIEKQIKKSPQATAIIHGRRIITYGDLETYANRLAGYLQDRQVQPDSRVVLFMRRSFEMLVAILAAWKCGAAYLPIDPQTPSKRMQQILAEAEPACIVSEPALLAKILQQNTPVVTLQDPGYFQYESAVHPDLAIDREKIGQQIAYIIYTSGSTGTPKGVMVSQDNLKNHVTWLIDTFQFNSTDVFSFNSPLAFDFSVPCTIAPLVVGASIIITSESDTLAIERYCQQLVENQVTFVKWTPSYFKLMIEYVEKHRPDLSSFKYLMVAGEALLTDYVRRWLEVYPFHHIVNEYGPTETTVGITAQIVTRETLDRNLPTVPIGKAVSHTELYVVNTENKLVEKGEIGELLIGGVSVACGYYKRPDLTDARFIDNPFSPLKNKLYRSGDFVKQLPDESYLYLGRMDHQVKIDGYRVELHEIEHQLLQYPGIKQAAVTVDVNEQKKPALAAYLVLKKGEEIDNSKLHDYLSPYLPHYMLPKIYHVVDHIPLTANGKRDYTRLKAQILKPISEHRVTRTENVSLNNILQVLKKYIPEENIDVKTSFSLLGITSLLAVQLIEDISQKCHALLRINDLFLYPTPLALANFLEHQNTDQYNQSSFPDSRDQKKQHFEPIAIIAMECRYPGADNCDELWDICRQGQECITFFDSNQTYPSSSNSYQHEVKARGILNNIEYFDAHFFRYSPKDAHLSDPQHRLLLETAWTALEKAGYAPGSPQLGAVGIYASMNESTYVIDHNLAQRSKNNFPDNFSLLRPMSSQFLATRMAYQLNCTGPSFTLQTACSSSLVCVAVACQQLAAYQCDVALAGGVSITTPQNKPYQYQQDNIFSPDGHCRPFDANANGTVFSNGLGVIVLKRLSDALRDNDTIIGILKGVGVNNDGSDKMSYAAPSIRAQAECIASAQAIAGVNADTIQYMEAHGTGTLVGDPIEIEALATAFRETSDRQQFCALGSIKANIGHTHVAAGIAGLMKAALALQHHEIPPAINFSQPNPNIDFDHSPFYVNTRLQHWPRENHPRRAAVSAFGVGGTNAHVILEEAPELPNHITHRQYHALLLSAKTPQALKEYHDKLIGYLEKALSLPEQSILLADVAYTFQVGRTNYPYRSSIVSECISSAIKSLKEAKNSNSVSAPINEQNRLPIVFLFPGQGVQYINLSLELYQEDVVYKEYLDRCLEMASIYMKMDIKAILFTETESISSIESKLYQTEFTHPILFSVEYALAQLFIHYGVKPDRMLGHSLGEYVAACVAGVFTLEEAIKIVCDRGRAIAQCVEGQMLSVPLSLGELHSFCDEDIHVAAVNAPQQCVLTGTNSAIQTFQKKIAPVLAERSLSTHQLHSHRPFHSPLLNPAVQSLQLSLKSIPKRTPIISYLSNLTGDWVTEEDIQRDDYWIEHMLKTVRFSDCVQKLVENSQAIFLEIGPGNTLLSLVQQHTSLPLRTIGLLPGINSNNKGKSNLQVIEGLRQLWNDGYPIQWDKYYQQEQRKRIPLPTYPFQRQRYWFDEVITNPDNRSNLTPASTDLALYKPVWIRHSEIRPLTLKSVGKECRWIIFNNHSSLSRQTYHDLNATGEEVFLIERGQHFASERPNHFLINPLEPEHYDQAIQKIVSKDVKQYVILHFWSADPSGFHVHKNLLDSSVLYQGFYSGIFIAQALNRIASQAAVSCVMITSQVHSVLGNEPIDSLKSGVLSLCRVLPLEQTWMQFRNIDIDLADIPKNDALYAKNIIHTGLTALFSTDEMTRHIVAFRQRYAWSPYYQPFSSQKSFLPELKIAPQSVYLITGGLGGMGLTFADWLSIKEPSVTLVLLSQTPFPPQEEWINWRAKDDLEKNTYQKIKQLQQIISRGSKVVIKSGDIADYYSMKGIISEIERHHGLINGIFHLAGVPGKGITALKARGDIRTVLSPKIQGIWVLARLFRRKKLDFVICASSLTAIAGGVGQIDYCAANIFLDQLMALKPFKNCQKHLTINWNAWSQVGMAAHVEDSKTHLQLYEENSISPEQGIAVLNSLLSSDDPQVIVSRFSPEDEIMRILRKFNVSDQQNEKAASHGHSTDLSATGIYEQVTQAWKDILGVNVIQDEDSFYSLGGDSLLAIQLVMLLKQRLNVDIALQDLAQASTLAATVKLIEYQPVRSEEVIIPLANCHLKQDNQKTIYFIHPLGGTILCYCPLVSRLKNNLPYGYYAIQDPELVKGECLFDSIDSMASYYSEKISEHEAHKAGEIILIGASFGGNVAIAMVAHLKRKSIAVQKVILIDSWANLGQLKEDSKLSSISPEELESMKMIRDYYGVHSPRYQLVKTRLSWLRSYRPAQVNIPVILLQAEELLPYYRTIASEDNGWELYCRQSFTRYAIAGNHDTMLQTKNLPQLSLLLQKLL